MGSCLHARNTTVQVLTLYTDPERHNAQRYRQTDDIMMPIADLIILGICSTTIG